MRGRVKDNRGFLVSGVEADPDHITLYDTIIGGTPVRISAVGEGIARIVNSRGDTVFLDEGIPRLEIDTDANVWSIPLEYELLPEELWALTIADNAVACAFRECSPTDYTGLTVAIED